MQCICLSIDDMMECLNHDTVLMFHFQEPSQKHQISIACLCDRLLGSKLKKYISKYYGSLLLANHHDLSPTLIHFTLGIRDPGDYPP